MGKSPKPLTILVSPSILEWPEIKELAEKGHIVFNLGTDLSDNSLEDLYPDLILHEKAWRMDPQHRKYLPLAIQAARKIKYPKGE